MSEVPSRSRREPSMAGILTKTVARSPVVRWILHARIRRKRCNDVVFVGDDFIEVKQVMERGHLEHIATKNDFGCRIQAAKAFSNVLETDDDDDFFIKIEDGEQRADDIPPQSIVLTTVTNELLFIHLTDDGKWSIQFVHQALPLPTFDKYLFQPGTHLAIDPYSRAVAVAANEREVVIYSAKPKSRVQSELRTNYENWCPVSAQRPLQVEGVIQQMEFLFPPVDDNGSYNEDQIILLLIVSDQKRTRAHWIEWFHTSDLRQATVRGGERLEAPNSVANLLIPLRNTGFLLIHGSEVTRYKDILCGVPVPTRVNTNMTDATAPVHPGSSPRRPVWVNWCRPLRGIAVSDETDYLYLIREDGRVFLFTITPTLWEQDHAGDFDCHVGSAFASVGSSRDPDILAVAGDMSTGQICYIGNWFSLRAFRERDRRETMEMELIENIPNWASVTDMVTSTLPGKSLRSRDGIFVTSGRQPYGAVTELRRGLEARLMVYFEVEGLRSVTEIWTLPLIGTGHILALLSSPAGTRMLNVSADFDQELIEELDDEAMALDSRYPTLAAAVTPDAKLVQITEHSIRLSPGTSANFEDCARVDCEPGTTNLAASIDVSRSIAVVAQNVGDVVLRFTVRCYALHKDDTRSSDGSQIEEIGTYDCPSKPLALTIASVSDQSLVFLATADGILSLLRVGADGQPVKIGETLIPTSADGPGACDSIVLLRSSSFEETAVAALLIVCGLRDGRIYSARVELGAGGGVRFGHEHIIEVGHTKVKVTQPSDHHSIAYAMSGVDTCLLRWDGKDPSALTIQNIFISDKLRPGLAQGPVVACTHLPPEHLLSIPEYADSLTMVSGDEFLVMTLEKSVVTVPRQIPVSGTPSRLIYAEQQRSLVCASDRYDVRTFPSTLQHGRPEERRQRYPVIDFISSKDDAPSYTYDKMQPGDRIFALLEWSYRPSEDKLYSFILVGSSHLRSSGAMRGRITFLQPSMNRNRTVCAAKEGWTMNFDAPVYALALMDDRQFVACTGDEVVVHAFSEDERRWPAVCEPYKLASMGIHVTTSGTFIFVSTNNDSLVCLEMVETESGAYTHQLRPRSMGPRAERLLSHLALTDDPPTPTTTTTITLLTTKSGELIALSHPFNGPSKSAQPILTAQLPRSLTRLHRCDIRPKWKSFPPPGVLVDNILGCAPDGTLIGVALLDQSLWRKLSWLQWMCEWSEKISPHFHKKAAEDAAAEAGMFAGSERVMPVGFGEGGGETDVVMRTRRAREMDGHIDGDVLARMMAGGKAAAKARMETVVRAAAGREDAVGEWVRRHLDDELVSIEEVLRILEKVLDCWI